MNDSMTDPAALAWADRSADVSYAVNGLDRLSERRDDAEFIAALQRAPEARTFILAGDVPLLRLRVDGVVDPYFSFEQADQLGYAEQPVLLGQSPERPVFATKVDAAILAPLAADAPAGPFDIRRQGVIGRDDVYALDLRSLATQAVLPVADLGALAQAKSVLHWHAFHGFCGKCGHSTAFAAAGWRRECPSCGTHYFPRTDPVVIMLAIDGERCLLGRQARFPKGNYSALAGFLEPGETIEAAVRREIREESGILVGRVDYLMSQPWPFPASLMIGCFAQASTREIVVDKTELDDARWFSRKDVAQMLGGTHPLGFKAPTSVAIAHHLLKAWFVGG